MRHVPIQNNESGDAMILFSHFQHEAPRGLWKKENVICLDNIKINVFLEGEFTVFSDNRNHRPLYGDVCLLPPRKLHCGQVSKPTYVNYYQLDVGIHALDAIPDGSRLIAELIAQGEGGDSFFRPAEGDKSALLRLCEQTERAVKEKAMPLAFAGCVALLSMLCRLYRAERGDTALFLSPYTQSTIQYIEAAYADKLTVSALAKRVAISDSLLSRYFKRDVGMSIHEYVNHYRVLKAMELLSSHSVADTCYACGFCDSSHFISVFKRYTNMTPRQYKKRTEE